MKKVKMFIVLLAAMPMLMMVSCKKENANTSSVRFKLTDAPGAFEAVNVDIKGVEIHSETEGWVKFNSTLGVVNLLDYMNGKTTFITEGEIAAGKVTQARLILGSENSVVIDGITYELKTPSAMQSGLKINLNNQLQAGGTYEWTIDFDAAQSIVTSATGSFILKPVLRLIVDGSSLAAAGGSTTIDAGTGGTVNGGVTVGGGSNGSIEIETGTGAVVNGDVTGKITGSVNSLIGLAIVTATDAQGKVTSTMTDLSGKFTLQAITEGQYKLTVDPVAALLSTKTITGINVAAGKTTDIGLVSL
ncbi:MAG: DUF4382 domain-containing protein [Chitinophagales bacterium]|nr:DUF4382 domain-containing protein [Chitinophagales bacterium]